MADGDKTHNDSAGGRETDASPADSADAKASWWTEMRPQLVKYFRKRLPAHAADDAANDTYLRVAGSAAIRNRTRYIWKVAKNVTNNWLKGRARRRRGDAEYLVRCDTAELRTPERVSEGQSELDVIARAALELPPAIRRTWEAASTGADPREIAEQLDMNLRRVYRHLDHIYEHFTEARKASERGGRSNDE